MRSTSTTTIAALLAALVTWGCPSTSRIPHEAEDRASAFLEAAAKRDTAQMFTISRDTGLVRNVLGWHEVIPGVLQPLGRSTKLEDAWSNNSDIHFRYAVSVNRERKAIDIVVRPLGSEWVVARAFISSEY